MNYKQMIIVAIAVTVIGVMFLVPPWITLTLPDSGQSNLLVTHSEHRLFNNPPKSSDVKEPYIAWSYPVQNAVATAVIAGILCFFLRTKKTREDVTANTCRVSAAAF